MRRVKKRYPLGKVWPVANLLMAYLDTVCHRIEVAGSVRRAKLEVGDIELVCIPRVETTNDLFGDVAERKDLLDERLKEAMKDPTPLLRKRVGFGPKNKLLTHVATGIPVDIFTATAENWGMTLMIRTGPAAWNIKMMSRFRVLGHRGHVHAGITVKGGHTIACPTEEDVFKILEWDYVKPQGRR